MEDTIKYTKLFPPDYPLLLKQLRRMPPFLYHAGASIPSDDNKFLCVVGARRYSGYGKEACDYLVSGLRGYPIVIVSGMALGIDSIAHIAALQNGLRTIAIPGSGLSEKVLYPRAHYLLARQIIETGNTLLSPFEPDQSATDWTFPVRNQVMAAISHATLIIEGGQKSGTLLTARYALDMDREVMIVPGSIFSELSLGPHTLYADGATPVMSPDDILRALGLKTLEDAVEGIDRTTSYLVEGLPNDQKMVIEELWSNPMSSSEIIEKLGISASHFGIIATRLELSGLVTEVDGIYHVKTKYRSAKNPLAR